jgi:hypothetical protein
MQRLDPGEEPALLSTLRSRMSFANVVSVAALFVALGGTSYAALSITGKNVKNSSLTTSDIKNRSLLSKDFKTGQLPRGTAGATGATGGKGDTGPTGPSDVYRAEFSDQDETNAPRTISVSVPAGSYLLLGKALVFRLTTTSAATCELHSSQDSGVDDIAYLNTGSSYGGLSNQDQASLPSGGTITLECSANGGAGSGAGNMQLAAVRVGALH